jgi:hypothetical protein
MEQPMRNLAISLAFGAILLLPCLAAANEKKRISRFSVLRAARRSCYVKSNLTVVDDTSAAAALNFLVAADFLAVAFRFLLLAAFLPADIRFRVRVAFFAAKLRFVGIGIPLVI